MWIGETVYFLSDRGGEFNLYSYDLKSRNVVRRTRHEGFPVESASAGAGRIIYEQAGYLHLFNPGTNDSTRLKIGVAADLAETRPRYVSNVKSIRGRGTAPEPGLGRAEPAHGPRANRRAGCLCLRTQHGGRWLRVLQALLLPASRQGGHHRR